MYFTDSTSKKMFKYKFDLLNAKLYEKKNKFAFFKKIGDLI